MALQMSGNRANVVHGHTDTDCIPDADWLRKTIEIDQNIKMVVVVNPNNPAGVVVARDRLEEISSICAEANVMLVW